MCSSISSSCSDNGESLSLHRDKHFMATTEGSLPSASLNGFERADPLVINAKSDLTLTKRSRKQSFSKFYHVCVLIEALRLVDKGKVKKSAVCCDILIVYRYRSKKSILLTGYSKNWFGKPLKGS